MRGVQSQSKLLGTQSASKNSRAQQQKELRQAQRFQQQSSHAPVTLQDSPTEFSYAQASTSKTVKNSMRPQQDPSCSMPAGPSSHAAQGHQPKSNLQAARAKIMSHSSLQQPNLFGGLSRHVINASSTARQNQVNSNAQLSHPRGTGSSGPLMSKPQHSQTTGMNAQYLACRQTSQHNVNYHQTVPTSPTNGAKQLKQPCARTLAAMETMNQQQQRMRKSESMNVNMKAVNQMQQHYSHTYNNQNGLLSPQPLKQSVVSNSAVKLNRLLGSNPASRATSSGQQQSIVQRHYIKKKPSGNAQTLINEVEDQDLDSEQRAYATLQQLQTQPVPHPQFMSQSPYPMSESGYSTQTFAQNLTSSLTNSGKMLKEKNQQNKAVAATTRVSKQSSVHAVGPSELIAQIAPQNDQTAFFQKDESLSGSTLVERATTPELTTPALPAESGPNHHQMSPNTRCMVDASVSTHMCCHEQAKHNAVLQQKVEFLSEQVAEEKRQAQMKEHQFNKMIAALKQTAEENLQKSKKGENAQNSDPSEQQAVPSQQDWKEIFDELNSKKEEVNQLQEKLLEQELKAEKSALDSKIKIQEKDDEISEDRLKLKHKESDLRTANQQIERLNEDLQNRIQEALDRQSDRMGTEKQNDLDAMNRRNEQLIKQLVDNHSAETRQLRALLLEKDHKCRDAEQQVGNLEIELRSIKLESGNRFNTEEIEEIQAQSQHVNEVRMINMKNQFQEENQQLREVIVQLEAHINLLQEGKSEADRQLIIVEDKMAEVKKEVARNKIVAASYKEKEEKLQQNFKSQIAKERKTADNAVKKVKGVQKLERELNNRQILINQLKAKILEMEREEQHKSKILLMKRRQIEDEKTVLIKKQALRQRSMTRSNLSATRMQHKLETQQAVIATERESKKALLQEKFKLEKEIVVMKRDSKPPGATRGDDSSRHNESMSMYFARSQGVFSPRIRADHSTKSLASKGSNTSNNKTSFIFQQQNQSLECLKNHEQNQQPFRALWKTSRPQVFLSQQTMDHNQLYLMKQQSANERTSSAGAASCSLQGGDSMVNIVQFDEHAAVSPRRHEGNDASILLSTPFKQDEPSEGKIMNLQFKTKGALSQSVIDPNSQAKVEPYQDDASRVNQIEDSGTVEFQTTSALNEKDSIKRFKTAKSKKLQQIQTAEEEEFIHVLSGCDTSNDSCKNVKNKNILRSLEKKPGTQMARKSNTIAGKQTKLESRSKELQEIKLMKASSASLHSKAPSTRTKTTSTLKELTTLNAKTSPGKLHMNMANMLTEQRLADSKESFVRTVLTARQDCEEFNSKIRKTEDHLLTTRNLNVGANGRGLDQTETSTFNQGGSHVIQSDQIAQAFTGVKNNNRNGHVGSTGHANIRQLNRNKTQQQFMTQPPSQGRGSRSPLSKALLNHSSNEACQQLVESDDHDEGNVLISNTTPETADEALKKQLAASQAPSEINNRPSTNVNSSFHGLFLHQLASMTGPMHGENSSQKEGGSQQSDGLVEENTQLKEQLELVKRSLAEHQQKAATTELTMMDAIMQMKEQISQVITTKPPANSSELSTPQTKTQQLNQRVRQTKRQHHDDYMVMSKATRDTPEGKEGQQSLQSSSRGKKLRAQAWPAAQSEAATEQVPLRKTNSMHLRQRSETIDFSQAQAESMYKKIKIKSPSKKSMQGNNKIDSGLTPRASTQGGSQHLQKQTASSAMKRQNLQMRQHASVTQFGTHPLQQTHQPQQLQTSMMPSSSQSFVDTSYASMQQRLSVGVLKQSMQSSANRASQQKNQSSMRYSGE